MHEAIARHDLAPFGSRPPRRAARVRASSRRASARGHAVTSLGDAVVIATLIAGIRRRSARRRFDQPSFHHARERTIHRADVGHRRVAAPLDVLDDPVAVPFAGGKAEQDMKLDRPEGRAIVVRSCGLDLFPWRLICVPHICTTHTCGVKFRCNSVVGPFHDEPRTTRITPIRSVRRPADAWPTGPRADEARPPARTREMLGGVRAGGLASSAIRASRGGQRDGPCCPWQMDPLPAIPVVLKRPRPATGPRRASNDREGLRGATRPGSRSRGCGLAPSFLRRRS